jgi:hypothetical protein
MARKWIINNNEIIMGNVEFHKDLLTDHTKTIGGGYYYYDNDTETMLFYSSSSDFGSVTEEQFNNAVMTQRSLVANKTKTKWFWQASLETVLKLHADG